MIRTAPPKNARAKRALEKREPKLIEDPKVALFIPGSNSTKRLHDVMVDLHALKKPDAQKFSKRNSSKNEIKPFEDPSSLEFFSQKNDAPILVLATHNKKRPNNLTFVRTFNYQVYDMIELRAENEIKLLQDFRKPTFQIGMRPLMTFNGSAFEDHPTFRHVKSLFMDMYRGQVSDLLDVASLQHVISLSVGDVEEGKPLPLVHFRVYLLKSYKSTEPKMPRIELDEIGPRLDFRVGRVQEPTADMEKEAFKRSMQLNPKTKKNIETDDMGDKIGHIHVGKQEIGKLQTRKMKGLKSRYDQDQDEHLDGIVDGEGSQKKKKRKVE